MKSLQGVVDKPLHQVIPKEDIDTIFFGIGELHEMHREFLDTLQPRMTKWTPDTAVADAFKVLVSLTLTTKHDHDGAIVNAIKYYQWP